MNKKEASKQQQMMRDLRPHSFEDKMDIFAL